MVRFGRALAVAALCLGAALSALAQGLSWETSTTSPELKGRTLRSVFSYMPGMLRQESPENGSATIYRLDRKLMISINARNRTYSEVTFDELEASLRRRGEAREKRDAESRRKLRSLPEDQRRIIEKGLPPTTATPPTTVVRRREARTISGFACAGFDIRQGERVVTTIWATKAVAGYAAMQRDMTDFSQRMAAMNPANGKAMAEAMRKVEGFPILTQIGERLTTTVVKVQPSTTAKTAFEPPAGYQRTPSPLLQ